jgi:hypothetical protein
MSGQVWAVSTFGGYFYSLNLSDELRQAVQPMIKFRQFADVKDASQQGKKKGDTFTWDTVFDVATMGGTLVETNTMGETRFTIGQGTLTVTEYGNSIPYSGKLEALSKFCGWWGPVPARTTGTSCSRPTGPQPPRTPMPCARST